MMRRTEVKRDSASASDSSVADAALVKPGPFADVWKTFETRVWEKQLNAVAGSEEVSFNYNGVGLGEVSRVVYESFVKQLEKSGQHCKSAYINGHFFITELPQQPHEYVKETVGKLLHIYANQQAALLGLPEHEEVLQVVGSALYKSAGRHKQADQGIMPFRGYDVVGLPTLVVEIGWAETLNALDDDTQLWLAEGCSTVKCVLIVKVWQLREGDTFAAVAAFYEREGAVLRDAKHQKPGIRPAWVTSFGTARPKSNAVREEWLGYDAMDGYLGVAGTECTAANRYPKSIPAALLYDTIPAGAGGDLAFNLHVLQAAAYRGLRHLQADKRVHDVFADD